jgi:hypothetical protein
MDVDILVLVLVMDADILDFMEEDVAMVMAMAMVSDVVLAHVVVGEVVDGVKHYSSV